MGAVIKTPISHFFGTSMWEGYHYPPAALSVSEQPGAGFISAEKTAFSEWVLCADERAVPSCTQCFFGVPAWGWYHYPRRALHAAETLDARGSRWRIRRFYAAPEFALCGLNLPSSGAPPSQPLTAHTAAHTPKHGRFGRGVVSLPSERFVRFGNPAWPGVRTAYFAAFGAWSWVLPKNAESLRNSDALMRVAVPRRRGPAGLRDLFRFCRNCGLYALFQILLSVLQTLQLVPFLCKLRLSSFLFGSEFNGFRSKQAGFFAIIFETV